MAKFFQPVKPQIENCLTQLKSQTKAVLEAIKANRGAYFTLRFALGFLLVGLVLLCIDGGRKLGGIYDMGVLFISVAGFCILIILVLMVSEILAF